MSFAIGNGEEIYVLDQLNSRIQVFKDSKRIKSIPIPKINSLYFKDIEITPENRIILVGEFYKNGKAVENYVYVLESNGKNLNLIKTPPYCSEIHIVNEGKFAGVWLSTPDGDSYQRIASLDGKTLDIVLLPGKPSRDSKRVYYAKILGDITAVVYRSQENSISMWKPEFIVNFDMVIIHLTGIWNDKKERLYFSVFLEGEEKGKKKIQIW